MPKCTICLKEDKELAELPNGKVAHEICNTKKGVLQEFAMLAKSGIAELLKGAKADLPDLLTGASDDLLRTTSALAEMLSHYLGKGLYEVLDAVIVKMLLAGPKVGLSDPKILSEQVQCIINEVRIGLVAPDEAVDTINELRKGAGLGQLKEDQATHIQMLAGRGID